MTNEINNNENNEKLQLIPIKRNKSYYPASFGQQSLWLLNSLDPDKSNYHYSQVYKIKGNIDLPVFIDSIRAVLNRHEICRVSFKFFSNEPVQIIRPVKKYEIPVINLMKYSDAEQQKEISVILAKYIHTPFNLSEGYLFRIALLKLKEDEYLFISIKHHIIIDDKSIFIFNRDIIDYYISKINNTKPDLQELPIQYIDYSVWQRKYLKGKVLDRQVEYWKDNLENCSWFLQLITDYPRPVKPTFKGGLCKRKIPMEWEDALKFAIKKMAISPAIFFLSVFKLLMYRYSNQKDLLIGMPFSVRNRLAVQDIMGYFVNTIVIRSKINTDFTFSEFVKQVNGTTMKAYAHGELPFEKVVDMIKPERNLSYNPLIQVLFNFVHSHPRYSEVPMDFTFEHIQIHRQTSKFDLNFSISDNLENGISIEFEYSLDLFKQATVEKMLNNYASLLSQILNNPEIIINELDLMSDKDKILIDDNFINTDKFYPNDNFIDLFENQVKLNPDNIAVVYEGQSITYSELNTRANQLGTFLRKKGIGPEHVVGLYVERSINLMVGMIGILKSGGAFLPVSTHNPIKRISYILEDAEVNLLITEDKIKKTVSGMGMETLLIDADWKEIDNEKKENIGLKYNPESLMYIIYTSGTTGNPKGVAVQNNSVINLWNSLNDIIYIEKNEYHKISFNGPLSFDTSVKQWLQFLNGHTLFIVPEITRLDANAFKEYIEKNKIEILDCTPSQLKALIKAGIFSDKKHCLKKILIGGESIDDETWNDLLKEKNIACYNLYGPTECTADSTIAGINDKDPKPHIGRPIPNTRVYILNECKKMTPVGMPGELYIGGKGLSRGYFSDRELTDNVFIQNPFENQKDLKLYKTGDLARYLESGNIEYIGRSDRQIKIRGFRIELKEIETAFKSYPEVEDAIVLCREKEGIDKYIIAYIKMTGKTKYADLEKYIQSSLPYYMMPSFIIPIDNIPLTRNGKINFNALPSYEDFISKERKYLTPKNKIEKAVSNIFSQILKVNNVGSNSNFFKLGGHSLAAAQLISRIKQDYNLELSIQTAFEAQTVSELAKRIEESLKP